jgi:hypothetical protein
VEKITETERERERERETDRQRQRERERVLLFALITKFIKAKKPRRIREMGRVARMGAIKNGAQFGLKNSE